MMDKARLKDLTKKVEEIMRIDRQSRVDDCYLYAILVSKLNPSACNYSFVYVMTHSREFGLPILDSVTRCRRKVLKEFPELRIKEVQEKRAENENVHREYFRQKLI